VRSGRLLLAGCLLHAGSAAAHDYWLLPDSFRVTPAGRVGLSLWVGDGFVPEDGRPWQRERTPRFDHVSAQGVVDLLARPAEGARPLLTLSLGAAGGHLFAMDRNAARVELPADRFERYLREEGLAHVVDDRRARGESARSGRERYTRCLKAFVQAGGALDGVSTRAVGQEFELVALDDLARLRPGAALRVAVRLRGGAQAGVLVEALSRVGGDVRRAAGVSDAAGRVTFTVDREGTWLLRAVHMERCEGCADAEWRSRWASYVFGICPPRARACFAAPMTTTTSADAGAAVPPPAAAGAATP